MKAKIIFADILTKKILGVTLLVLGTIFSLSAQTSKPVLRVDGEEKNSGVKVTLTNELLIESSFAVKRVKILRKVFNEYKLESYVDVKPASKNVGFILTVSANKLKSGDQIQLLLIPDNETMKIPHEHSVLYLNIE